MQIKYCIILIPFSFLTSFTRSMMNVVANGIRNNSLQRIGPTTLTHPIILVGNHETSMWDNAQGWFNEDKYADMKKKLG